MATLQFYGEAIVARFNTTFPPFPNKRQKELEKLAAQMKDECETVANLSGFVGIEFARGIAHGIATGSEHAAQKAFVSLLASLLAYSVRQGWPIDAMVAELIASKREAGQAEATEAAVAKVSALAKAGKLPRVTGAFANLETLLKRSTRGEAGNAS